MNEQKSIPIKLVNTDKFLTMPISAQLLYFHFRMRSNCFDGIQCPKCLMLVLEASEDDLNILIDRGFVSLVGSKFFIVTKLKK
jgi:hypothetical protein